MCVALVNLLQNLQHVSRTHVRHESRLTGHAAFELLLGVASAEAKVDEVRRRQCTGTFGREGAFAVECIVSIDGTSLFVSRHRNAATQVANDEVQVLVARADALGITSGNGTLVQCMPNAHTRHERRAADTGFGHKFVNHARIGNVSLAAIGLHIGQFVGNDAAQVAGVLTHGIVRVVTHFAVHAIHTAGNRFRQSATADNGIEHKGNVVILEPVDNQLFAKVLLVGNGFEGLEFFGRMSDVAHFERLVVNVDSHLCRSGARVNYEYAKARLLRFGRDVCCRIHRRKVKGVCEFFRRKGVVREGESEIVGSESPFSHPFDGPLGRVSNPW